MPNGFRLLLGLALAFGAAIAADRLAFMVTEPTGAGERYPALDTLLLLAVPAFVVALLGAMLAAPAVLPSGESLRLLLIGPAATATITAAVSLMAISLMARHSDGAPIGAIFIVPILMVLGMAVGAGIATFHANHDPPAMAKAATMLSALPLGALAFLVTAPDVAIAGRLVTAILAVVAIAWISYVAGTYVGSMLR